MDHPSTKSLGQHIADPLAHFQAIPWCAKVLSDKSIISRETPARNPSPDGSSSLVNETLNSAKTVRACTSFFRYVKGPMGIDRELKEKKFFEFVALVDLGTGLDGWKETVHGGIQSVILDEVTSNAVFHQSPNGAFTRTLKLTYNKPISTPQIVLVRGNVSHKEGRKIYVRGTIEDNTGTILTEAEALWLTVDKRLNWSKL